MDIRCIFSAGSKALMFSQSNKALIEWKGEDEFEIITYLKMVNYVSNIAAFENVIVISSMNGRCLYALTKDSYGKNVIDKIEEKLFADSFKVRSYAFENELLCFLDDDLSKVYSFDVQKHTFRKINIDERFCAKCSPYWNSSGSIIYFIDENNRILHYDIRSNVIASIIIGKDDKAYSSCLFDGENLWLTHKSGSEIIKCDSKGNILETLLPFCSSDKDLYSNLVDCGESVVVLPRFGDNIVYIDKTTMQMSTLCLTELGVDSTPDRRNWAKILTCIEKNNTILFPGNGFEKIFCTDRFGQILKLYDDSIFDKAKMKNDLENNSIVYERSDIGLKEYLSVLR